MDRVCVSMLQLAEMGIKSAAQLDACTQGTSSMDRAPVAMLLQLVQQLQASRAQPAGYKLHTPVLMSTGASSNFSFRTKATRLAAQPRKTTKLQHLRSHHCRQKRIMEQRTNSRRDALGLDARRLVLHEPSHFATLLSKLLLPKLYSMDHRDTTPQTGEELKRARERLAR